jgi:hypothetical protein
MMSNISRAQKLEEAIALLKDADNCMQAALGATDECYELHNALEDIQTTLEEYAEQLIEMQITE